MLPPPRGPCEGDGTSPHRLTLVPPPPLQLLLASVTTVVLLLPPFCTAVIHCFVSPVEPRRGRRTCLCSVAGEPDPEGIESSGRVCSRVTCGGPASHPPPPGAPPPRPNRPDASPSLARRLGVQGPGRGRGQRWEGRLCSTGSFRGSGLHCLAPSLSTWRRPELWMQERLTDLVSLGLRV